MPDHVEEFAASIRVRRGVTRTVLVGKRWAVKFPWGQGRSVLRGWLANRSEWRQRHRDDVARPILTLGHLALVFPAADEVGDDLSPSFGPWLIFDETAWENADEESEVHRDEMKPSSWGRFGERWLIIDFDRAWTQHDRGLVGRLYYGRQERLARRWTAGATSKEPARNALAGAVVAIAIELAVLVLVVVARVVFS